MRIIALISTIIGCGLLGKAAECSAQWNDHAALRFAMIGILVIIMSILLNMAADKK